MKTKIRNNTDFANNRQQFSFNLFSWFCSHEAVRDPRKAGPDEDTGPELVRAAFVRHHRRRSLRGPHVANLQPQIMRRDLIPTSVRRLTGVVVAPWLLFLSVRQRLSFSLPVRGRRPRSGGNTPEWGLALRKQVCCKFKIGLWNTSELCSDSAVCVSGCKNCVNAAAKVTFSDLCNYYLLLERCVNNCTVWWLALFQTMCTIRKNILMKKSAVLLAS